MEAPTRTTPFGKYELIEKVASGGMAEVFRARTRGGEAGFEKYLAIKRILPHLSRDSEFVVMLIDEAKIAVTLNHANVVQIYDLGKADGTYYIAMEFVEGADLKAVLLKAISRGGPIPPALAVFLIMEVLKGLEYAHQKKVMSNDNAMDLHIIHRDISPPNILISYEGEVKIVDFGIAKANTRMMETSAGVLKGKFEYMSPEQAAGLQLDHRTDIFSAALCLYEAMTGKNPFTATSDLQVIQNVRAGRFPPASQLNPRIPRRLDQILNRAMARDKEDRYQSATELRNDLAHAAYETGLIATSPKLATYMKSLFDEELSVGRPFVSGSSVGTEAGRQNLAGGQARSRSPYHVASELNGGWSDPVDYDPRTVIRTNPAPEEAPPPPRPRPAPEPPPRSRVEPPPAQRRAPPPPRQEDFSADATFLAPQRPAAPPPKPARSLGPAAPAPRPPVERIPDEEAQATFLAPAPAARRPVVEEDEDAADAFQTLRDMEPPFEDAQTDPRGRHVHDDDDEAGPQTVTSAGAPPVARVEERPTVSAPVAASAVERPTTPARVAQQPTRALEKATDPAIPPSGRPGHETTDVPGPGKRLPPGSHFEPLGGPYGDAGPSPTDWGDSGYRTPSPQPAGPTAPGEHPRPGIGATWRTHLAALMIGLAFGVLGTGALVSMTESETQSPQMAAPASDTAEVVVHAPEGAITQINGQEVGRSYPLTLALPVATPHQLEVQVEGRRPYRQTVEVSAGQTRIFDLTVVQPSILPKEEGGAGAESP